MKIGINLLQLNPGKIGGMERYIRTLIRHILEEHVEIELFLFVTTESISTFPDDVPGVSKILIDHATYGKTIFSSIVQEGISLYFCPLLVIDPVLIHIPTVVCIPDMQHEYFPEFFTDEILAWRRLHFKASADAATGILTLSHYSAETISAKLGVSSDKVHAVHLAADDAFGVTTTLAEKDRVRAKYALPEIFGYYPANTWPHKNHLCLLDALVAYRTAHGSPPVIVLTGAMTTGSDPLTKEVCQRDLQDFVRFIGYVPHEDLPVLYQCAQFLVFPSLFEGFGLPVVEAMMSDCPVICSNTTSLPEVAADAALYFDPLRPDQIADAMYRVLHDAGIRKELLTNGRSRAAEYSWRSTAEQTVAIFNAVLKAKRPEPIPASPRITVVTPSYNQGEFIEETILSVIGQGYPNLEYLVNDGGSTDNTVEILKKYTDRVLWVSQKDNGQADAVNKGFQQATGEILGWLNSDDTYLPGALDTVMKAFRDNPQALMVYGNAYYTNRYGSISGEYLTERFDSERLAHKCYICQPAVFIKKELFAELGDLDVSLHTCMDYEYWLRVSKHFHDRVIFIDDFLATSRMYDENKTLALREKVYSELFATVKKYHGFVPDSWVWGFIVDVIKGIYLNHVPWPLAKIMYWKHVYVSMRKYDLPRMARIALSLW